MLNEPQREFTYTLADFEQVSRILYRLTGIRLAPNKDSMVYSRLVRRIRALSLSGFEQYLQYLQQNPSEEQAFINALTTNLTAFFREPHHFELLQQYALSQPLDRIWCAACSSGEEAYSIAMTLVETFGRFDLPIQLMASDIDSQVLATARQGIYPLDRVKNMSAERLKTFFYRGTGSQQGRVKVVPELQRMVQFKQINLLEANWPIPKNLDVIFCRNVMIYFDKETQLRLLERMVALLKPEGLYMAGHSENFSLMGSLVQTVGKTTYSPSLGGLHGRR